MLMGLRKEEGVSEVSVRGSSMRVGEEVERTEAEEGGILP